MALIAQGDFEALADSASAQIVEGQKEFDNTGGLATSFTLGALANVTRCVGLGDAEQEADLIGPARSAFDMSKAQQILYTPCRTLLVALSTHMRKHNLDGISGFCASVNTRVDDNFRSAHHASLGIYPTPASVWPPPIVTGNGLGLFVSDGAGGGVFTDGVAVDSTKYSGGQLYAEITVESTAGAPGIAWTLDVTVTAFDGTSSVEVVTFAGGSTVGTQVDVGTHPGDQYIDVTLIAVNVGDPGAAANNDAVKIFSEDDRAIAL